MSSKASYLAGAEHRSLMPTRQRGGGVTDGPGVDVQSLSGVALVLLDATYESGSGTSLAVRLQHGDLPFGPFVDLPGGGFSPVGTAGGAQALLVEVGQAKRYLRVRGNATGTSPVYAWGVQIIGLRQYGGQLLQNFWQGGGVLALESELKHHLVRNHAFSVLPPVHRNTFAATPLLQLGPPSIDFRSNGSDEDNKILEIAVERVRANGDLSRFRGIDATVDGDFAQLVVCQLSHYVTSRAAFSANSWVGIEFGSAEANTMPAGTPASGYFHLRRHLHTDVDWSLVIGRPVGAPVVVPFVVPKVDPGAPFDGGHLVGIYTNPFTFEVKAFVDGEERAAYTTSPEDWPYLYAAGISGDSVAIGLVAYSGTMNAAATLEAQWAGLTVINFDTDKIGSGLV